MTKLIVPENINEFNRYHLYKEWRKELRSANKPRKGALWKNALFYCVLILMVLMAVFFGGKSGAKRIGPFAYNTVLTTSMRSVYPKGSLITSWAISENETLNAGLADGTDIVFMKDDESVVVHRIIEIMEDYEDTGVRAFRTQGVDNKAPDSWITYEPNVIGRVTWHVPYVGEAFLIIQENPLLFGGAVGIICAAFICWQYVFKKTKPTDTNGENTDEEDIIF
ncbi:MAG: signal peptidase I [Oscillospiraceae bacterium]|jgi:signal peptidase I|nr:signal peptidase I [Oscillospiraceae bacterium]